MIYRLLSHTGIRLLYVDYSGLGHTRPLQAVLPGIESDSMVITGTFDPLGYSESRHKLSVAAAYTDRVRIAGKTKRIYRHRLFTILRLGFIFFASERGIGLDNQNLIVGKAIQMKDYFIYLLLITGGIGLRILTLGCKNGGYQTFHMAFFCVWHLRNGKIFYILY